MNRVQQGMRTPRVHTDDWLITYADMITLLLCFFVIFFVILYARKNGPDGTIVARAPAVQDTHSTPRNDIVPFAAQSEAEISAFNDFAAIGPAKPSARPAPKADRISMFEMSSSAFFGSGSADLSDSGKSILRDVAVELKSGEYQGYQIVVEGHTDDSPIATAQFSSNWELSTARAAAVVHFFLDQGLPAQRLRAAGYADTQPKAPNRDASGAAIPENQAQNRRVVIRLEKIEISQ